MRRISIRKETVKENKFRIKRKISVFNRNPNHSCLMKDRAVREKERDESISNRTETNPNPNEVHREKKRGPLLPRVSSRAGEGPGGGAATSSSGGPWSPWRSLPLCVARERELEKEREKSINKKKEGEPTGHHRWRFSITGADTSMDGCRRSPEQGTERRDEMD
jgi:hypothetical protein